MRVSDQVGTGQIVIVDKLVDKYVDNSGRENGKKSIKEKKER